MNTYNRRGNGHWWFNKSLVILRSCFGEEGVQRGQDIANIQWKASRINLLVCNKTSSAGEQQLKQRREHNARKIGKTEASICWFAFAVKLFFLFFFNCFFLKEIMPVKWFNKIPIQFAVTWKSVADLIGTYCTKRWRFIKEFHFFYLFGCPFLFFIRESCARRLTLPSRNVRWRPNDASCAVRSGTPANETFVLN